MLKLTRRSGEGIYIYPNYSKVSPSATIGDVFGESGCLTFTVEQINGQSAKLGIDAPNEFTILRCELEDIN